MTSPPAPPARGMALVTVLAILAMLAMLVLALLFSARVERQSSAFFVHQVDLRFLSETSVNLVLMQIADATTPVDQAWVSQPGLIRTYRANQQPSGAYRLYSWAPMRSNGAFDPFDADNAIPPTWDTEKARFVDLNQPVPSIATPDQPAADHYPILYPPTPAHPVAGYSVAKPPRTRTDADLNAVPMPVQWLYVLKDGTAHTAVPVPGAQDTVQISAATRQNPIVGRIAFWADDETTKLNLNTAAGGAWWTPPVIATPAESELGITSNPGLGRSQPMRNEYQRYPGHPARTDLRAVFPELSWDEIYTLAPKIVSGGSANGTVNVVSRPDEPVPDTDRLYASVGELFYSARKPSATVSRPVQSTASGALHTVSAWKQAVERRKGFLTVYSRAPELTVAGTPKVSIWPLATQESHRTALDRLIAFCSTIGTGPDQNTYYFTREDSLSPSADISLERNTALYRYLQRLSEDGFPGVTTGSFATKYGPRERDQILTQIFDYIRSTNIQDMQLPAARRFNNRALVVPTRWDPGNGLTSGFGRAITLRQIGLHFICNADGAVPASNQAPETAPNGSGAMPNRSLEPASGGLAPDERRIQAMLILELFSPSAGYKMFDTTLRPVVRVHGLESLSVSTSVSGPVPLGFPDGNSQTRPLARDLSSYNRSFGANGGAMNYRWIYMSASGVYPPRTTGGLQGNDGADGFPYISLPVTLKLPPDGGSEMTLSGGVITVEVYTANATTGEPDQLITSQRVQIPSTTVPVPRLHPSPVYWAFHPSGIYGDYHGSNAPTGTRGRLATSAFTQGASPPPVTDAHRNDAYINQYDTVQTFTLPHGDLRQLFRPETGPHPLVPLPAGLEFPSLRHALSDADNCAVLGQDTSGTLAADVPVLWRRAYATPMLSPDEYASSLPAVTPPWRWRDWDTGSPIRSSDGPLINKPDEGNQNVSGNAKLNPYWVTYSVENTGGNLLDGLKYHTANRQLPSPVMFGSLPTGLISGKPWQTLLFRPAPDDEHPGEADPPDHLLLELFWMPVVEPYAISEPFSTAGKINLNYQMIPFTYIERSTGLHAVLMNERLIAIPETNWGSTGGYRKDYTQQPAEFDHGINIPETLRAFENRFAAGRLFLTPSEITTLPLVPDVPHITADTTTDFWNQHRLTGENLRERAYAHLYPRLTTRSNVFTIHYRVQLLRQPPGATPGRWEEPRGHILAEHRGSTVVERAIDMNRSGLTDFATDQEASANPLYRFRILSEKSFTP